jgi:peroxiredoxin
MLPLCLLCMFLPLILGACQKTKGNSTAGTAQADVAPSAAKDGALAENVAAGTDAPNIALNDLQGKHRELKDFKGKTVLLNFWATWCVPCVAEMGSLERLYKAYHDKNLEIVAVNVDAADSQKTVENFVRDNGITFPILRDPDFTYPPQYGLSGFPESFFINPQGKFVKFLDAGENKQNVRVVGDRAWDSEAFLKNVGDVLTQANQ